MNAFWDDKYQGYYWQLNRDGSIADPSKLIYGEGFAIYALSEFARVYGIVKRTEYEEFLQVISPWEREHLRFLESCPERFTVRHKVYYSRFVL